MPQVTVNNVDVDFPFSPYKCQEDYMGHVIRALQSKQNAILESPTGTGKTLCLLCSVLAWRLTYIAKLQLSGMAANANITGLDEAAGNNQASEGFNAIPKIIYASRTHSQISQVVNELKNTIYKPKVSVLGSRDQLCLHPKVMKIENNMAKIHTCRAKVKERSCVHYTNVDKKINDAIFGEILDIEELVSVSKEKTMCPYYSSRELLRRADIIFMPYNYLIDSKTRKNQNITLENSIVIFDEAHNIEKVCEESYSFEITSLDIANCIENCQLTLQRILDDDGSASTSSGPSYDSGELTKEDVLTMKAIFLSLEREFNKLEVKGSGNIIDKSTFKNLLVSINVNQETKGLITEVLQKMESVLSLSSSNKLVGNTFVVLNNFMQILDLTLDQSESSKHQYVCYVSKEKKDSKYGKSGKASTWVDKNIESVAPQFITKLSYWCFSPGLAMEEFVKSGVYSIILTSGTLSPINSFSCELRIPFPITLQNPHVIQPSQISVQIICKGCDGTDFLSTYANRSNPKYLSSLGTSIVNLLRIIPNGVLVFFPSYGVMNNTIQSWQTTNIYSRMLKTKHCFTEPRSKNEMATLMSEFDDKVRNPTDGATGAMLFAVCRGKASEGIDFADMHGRAVIITGLPFPPKNDPKVSAKINYLDQQKRNRPNSLNGQEWYIQQSSRAVNQAVGRVIRHKDDFGAVIFMDKRFSFRSNVDELPKWARGFAKVNEQFGSGLRELSQFFKLHVNRVCEKEEKEEPVKSSNTNRLSNMYDAFRSTEKDLPRERFAAPNLDDSTHEVTPPPRKMARTDKRVSLISSLSGAGSADYSFAPSMSPVSSRSTTDYKTPEAIRNPRKKFRLVTKRDKENDLDSLSQITSVMSSPLASTQREQPKVTKSQNFSATLKSSLSEAEYEVFRGVVKEYKTEKNIVKLIDNVTDLFMANHKELLKGFRIFLKDKDKATFDKFLSEKGLI